MLEELSLMVSGRERKGCFSYQKREIGIYKTYIHPSGRSATDGVDCG